MQPIAQKRHATILAPRHWWLAVVLVVILAAMEPQLLRSYRMFQARQSLEARREQEAVLVLKAALAASPADGEIRFLLARAYRRLGRLNQVREELASAYRLKVAPQRIRREEWLALAQSGQMREAEPHLSELMLDPGDDGREICEAFVNGYFRNKDFERALPILDVWEKDFPDDPQPHVYYAIRLQEGRQWKSAAEAYTRALALDPDRTDVRLSLALALLKGREFAVAAAEFERCQTADPDDPRPPLGRADALAAMGNNVAARKAYEEALHRETGRAAAELGIAKLDLSEGRVPKALPVLEQLAAEFPSRTDIRFALGNALVAAGRADEARPHLNFVEEMSRLSARIVELTSSVRKQPDNADLRYQLGAVTLQMGDDDSGVQWLMSALDCNPNHSAARQLLAEHYDRSGHPDLAESFRQSDFGSEPPE